MDRDQLAAELTAFADGWERLSNEPPPKGHYSGGYIEFAGDVIRRAYFLGFLPDNLAELVRWELERSAAAGSKHAIVARNIGQQCQRLLQGGCRRNWKDDAAFCRTMAVEIEAPPPKLTERQTQILLVLHDKVEPQAREDLASAVNRTARTCFDDFNVLQQYGYIGPPRDGKQKLVLTAKGKKLVDKLLENCRK